MLGRVIVVTGIPGIGKSSVCKEVQKLLQEKERKITVINYGTVMTELLQKKKERIDRDDLRKSKLFLQRSVQVEAAKAIAEKISETEEDVIIDTHMSIKTPYGYLAGLPFHVLNILNPEMFILIEASPSEVLSRRFRDVTRKRDKALESEIEEELLFSRLMACACAVLTGAAVKIVRNSEGKKLEAAKEILKLLR